MTDAADRSSTPLTRAEEQFLAAHGGPAPTSEAEKLEAMRRSSPAAGRATLEQTFSAQAVAVRLGLTPAAVQSLVDQGKLYRFTYDGSQEFPSWQFTDEGLLPDLATVLTALGEAHPETVAGFMTLSSDELDGLSPVQWLAAGRAATNVVLLAESLFVW